MCYYVRRIIKYPTFRIGDFPDGLRLYAYCLHPIFPDHHYQSTPRDERDFCRTKFVLWPGVAEQMGIEKGDLCTKIEGVNFFPTLPAAPVISTRDTHTATLSQEAPSGEEGYFECLVEAKFKDVGGGGSANGNGNGSGNGRGNGSGSGTGVVTGK